VSEACRVLASLLRELLGWISQSFSRSHEESGSRHHHGEGKIAYALQFQGDLESCKMQHLICFWFDTEVISKLRLLVTHRCRIMCNCFAGFAFWEYCGM